MRSTRLGLILGALLTFGCLARPQVQGPYLVSVEPGLEYQGLHNGLARTIEFGPECLLEEVLVRHVAAHEIGHALGCSHQPAPSIMASRHGLGEAPIYSLTRIEAAAAKAAARRGQVVEVRVDPAKGTGAIRAWTEYAVDWACALWNQTAGAVVVRRVP